MGKIGQMGDSLAGKIGEELAEVPYLILSYLIVSYLILSYLILSYLILSCLILGEGRCGSRRHQDAGEGLSYLILSYLR